MVRASVLKVSEFFGVVFEMGAIRETDSEEVVGLHAGTRPPTQLRHAGAISRRPAHSMFDMAASRFAVFGRAMFAHRT